MNRAAWITGLACIASALGARCVAEESAGADEPPITEEDRQFWAFRAPVDPPLPPVANSAWPRGSIDSFVLAGLEAAGLQPARTADKRTFIRRATFDLHGLPPTPDEVAQFLEDNSDDAFARLIDRLLASPRYGERWGRHWLDLARYSDSNGMDENMAMAEAWRYRDWVVAAFNSDTPYDAFLRDQLAGDLLPSADEATNHARWVATGFLVLGPKMLAEDDPVKMEMDIIDEQIDTIGRAVMGMTLGCARCHDHKFDPISTADYYSLAGIFKSTKTMEHYRVVAQWFERPLAPDAEVARLNAHKAEIERVKAEIRPLEDAVKSEQGTAAGAEPKAGRDPTEASAKLAAAKEELAALEKSKPNVPHALAVTDRQAQNLRIHLRGDHMTLGAEVPRRFPRILAGDALPQIAANTSGRLDLANWLTRSDHPLTSRVMVNRIWQGHFGQGLVRSSDNFGRLGEAPDHQPLLDWLTRRFVESDWSIKTMHRLIMTSSAYQMSTDYDGKAAARDPENRLLWRMNRRRLAAEEIRDAILSIGAGLDLKMGGSLLTNKNHTYVTSTASVNDVKYDNMRRSIFLPVVRSSLYDMFGVFDFADPSTANGKRPATTVAPQALFMMNSALVEKQTRAMAEDLLNNNEVDALRVRAMYLRAYGRPCSDEEASRGLQFVDQFQSHLTAKNVAAKDARLSAWQALCRALISSNEFIYVN
jgi:hypothetical protein